MKRENENGSLIIESTFVFPIMFFILIFLILSGNMFYMRSRVDSLANEYAVKAAAYCADPLLATIGSNGSVPTSINDVKPYHFIFGNDSSAGSMENELRTKINRIGEGFFSGMGLKDTNVTFNYDKGLVTSVFTVDVSYRIRFPVRFLGNDSPVILSFHSKGIAPVTDTGEFIQNVDMAMDFMDSSGVSKGVAGIREKFSEIKQKIGEFFS